MNRSSQREYETEEGDAAELGAPAKKIKLSVKQKYRVKYAETWPFLGPSEKSVHHVRCSICVKDFLCAHAGAFDCKKHVASASHKEEVAKSSKNKTKVVPITGFFVSNPEKPKENKELALQRQIISAEVTMCEIIAEMNLPIATADIMSRAFSSMFPDSHVAKGKLLV